MTIGDIGNQLFDDRNPQLPAIYSGIGVGVYQGEIVTFRQMAVGEKRWVVSKLQPEDLSLLSPSTLDKLDSLRKLL